MATLSVSQATREYQKQLADVEAQLVSANTRVESCELALKRAYAAAIRAGAAGGPLRLNEDDDYREADEAVMSAKSARSRLDVRRTELRQRLRGLDAM